MKYRIYIERYAQKQILKLDKKAIPFIKQQLPNSRKIPGLMNILS